MVVVKMMAGLGNQMFQFAFALPYILQGKEVMFDTAFFKKTPAKRSFELDRIFDINIPQATRRVISYFIEKVHTPTGPVQFQLKKGRTAIIENKEMEFTYYEELEEMDDVYFSGYWQHQEYFKNCSGELKSYFQFPLITAEETENQVAENMLLTTNSVGIHIRRGDYLISPVHRALPPDYYTKAIAIINSEVSEPCFFIFSDDMEWAKNNLPLENAVYVDWNKGESAFRDMHLMQICNHNIIANSTFSWWPAWLNNHPDKIVIAPEVWFNKDIDMGGLLLDGWIKL